MWAEVRPLRLAGRRLTRERVLATEPRRGRLIVFKRSDPWRNCMVPVAGLLAPDQVTYLLPPLDQVRIARWTGPDLVLVGLEDQGRRKREVEELQAWWVHLIADQEPPQTPPLAPPG